MSDDTPPGPAAAEVDDLPEDRQRPPLRASVAVLASETWCEKVRGDTPDEITVETYREPPAFEAEVSGEVAVALLEPAHVDAGLERLVKRTIAVSAHARIAFLARGQSDPDVPRDADIVAPISGEAFATRVERLYVRAHYAATLDRYYSVSMKIRNAELADGDAVDDDQLDRLRTVRNRSRAYLRQFRAGLDGESLASLKSRNERLQNLVAESKSAPEPRSHGLSETCPNCGLDWTEWYGQRLEKGFQKLGANTWQCRECGETIASASPSNYKVS
jgi:rRNA maturation protein Nop10